MIIPRPLPDEIDDGYCGRIKFLNGFKSNGELFKELRKNFGFDKDYSRLQMVSEATRLQFAEMLASHTLIPLEYGFMEGGVSSMWLEHGTAIAKINTNWVHCYEVRYCHRCIDQDSDEHGISFWHRAHQIYGVSRCLKHGEVLRYSRGREQEHKYMLSPLDVDSQRWGYGGIFDSELSEEDEYIYGYGKVCSEYMQRYRIESDEKFVERIIGCLHINTLIGPKEINNFLKYTVDETINHLSPSWLEKYFPRFKPMFQSGSRMTFDSISNPRRRLAKSSHYALIETLAKDVKY